MAQRGSLRGVAVLCAGAVLLAAAGCTGGAEEGPQEPKETKKSRVGWQEGEVRPKEVENACALVSDDTLALLDLTGLRHESPNCLWNGGSIDTVQRTLSVSVEAYTPGNDLERATATDEAETGFREGSDFGTEEEDPEELTGLGDEALVAGPGPLERELVVRQNNVIVRVSVWMQYERPDYDGGRLPSQPTVEAALLAATEDVLDATAAPLDERPAPDPAPGEVARPQPACDGLSAQGARLLPGAEPTDISPDSGDVSNCYWTTADKYAIARLGVDVQAVPPSALTGRTGVAEAKGRFVSWAEADRAEPVGGLGDEAVVDPEADYLHVRRDNLLVTVRDIRKGVPRDQGLADMQSVARTVLAQYE